MHDKILWPILIIIVCVRIFATWPYYENGQILRVSGTVDSEPIYYEHYQQINLEGLRIYLTRFPEIKYGDEVVVEGEYQDKKINDAELISLTKTKNPLYRTRQKIIEFYKSTLPEPDASLVAGMVLGSRSDIPREFWDQLITTGTAHVVVASGANIALVAGFMLGALVYFFKRRKALLIVFIFIWIYTLMVGFDAPIIRAAIMGTIAFTAELFGRVKSTIRIFILSALIMLIVWPQWIADYAFLLSFGATASLLLFNKKIYTFLKGVPDLVREDLSTSLSAQILIAPMLIIMFGRFSFISPIVNTLVLWTVAPITIIGMIAGMLSLIFEPLAKLVLFGLYPLTFWFSKVVEIFANLIPIHL